MKTISTSIFCLLACSYAEGKCSSVSASTNYCAYSGHSAAHSFGGSIGAPDTINTNIVINDTIIYSIFYDDTFCGVSNISVMKDSFTIPTFDQGFYNGNRNHKIIKCLYSGPGNYNLSFSYETFRLEKDFIFNPVVSGLIENDHKSSILVFPNPSSSIFNFDGVNPGNEINVYDFTGVILKQFRCSSIVESVDLGKFSRALYYYRIIDDERRILKSGKLLLN